MFLKIGVLKNFAVFSGKHLGVPLFNSFTPWLTYRAWHIFALTNILTKSLVILLRRRIYPYYEIIFLWNFRWIDPLFNFFYYEKMYLEAKRLYEMYSFSEWWLIVWLKSFLQSGELFLFTLIIDGEFANAWSFAANNFVIDIFVNRFLFFFLFSEAGTVGVLWKRCS